MPIKKIVTDGLLNRKVLEHSRRPKHLVAGPDTKYPVVIDSRTTVYTNDKSKIPGILKKWKERTS